jgi:hypothetical protein
LKTVAIFLVQKMTLQIFSKPKISSWIDFQYSSYQNHNLQIANIVHWFQHYREFHLSRTILLDSPDSIIELKDI